MFGLLGCTHYFNTHSGQQIVFSQLDFMMEHHHRVGILAAPGSGKTTLARLLCNIDEPIEGDFIGQRGDAILLGGNAFMLAELTGEENVRMMADLYQLDADECSHFCYQLSELGHRYTDRVAEYSNTMKASLAFAINLLLPCRLYVADEKLFTGDSEMQKKMDAALSHELNNKGLLVLTRNPRILKACCQYFGVLLQGRIVMCRSAEEASALFGYDNSTHSVSEPERYLFDS